MFDRDVYIQYQLAIDQRFRLTNYEGFKSGGNVFVLVPVQMCTTQDPNEILETTQFLNYMGDYGIAQLVPTMNGQYESIVDGNPIYLFRIPKIKAKDDEKSFGKQLAAFHYRGSKFQPTKMDMVRSGRWSELWAARLDNIKGIYSNLVQNGGISAFDQLFLETFPYYEAIAENAIQYNVDTDIDGSNTMRYSTITHQRLTYDSWIKLNEKTEYVKLPIQFVYDDPMRDVAEWIRNTRYNSGADEDIEQFLKDYNEKREIAADDIRKLYGRLLFPIAYMDTVESYYLTKRNTLKEYLFHELKEVISFESENELFLRDFSRYFNMNRSRIFIPQVEWLTP